MYACLAESKLFADLAQSPIFKDVQNKDRPQARIGVLAEYALDGCPEHTIEGIVLDRRRWMEGVIRRIALLDLLFERDNVALTAALLGALPTVVVRDMIADDRKDSGMEPAGIAKLREILEDIGKHGLCQLIDHSSAIFVPIR